MSSSELRIGGGTASDTRAGSHFWGLKALPLPRFSIPASDGSAIRMAIGYTSSMRVAKGKVIHGQVVLEGQALPEGAEVVVYVEDEGGFHLDDDSLRELVDAQAEIRRGHFVTADAVLAELEH